MRVQRCKGTRDLSPEEMEAFRLIEGTFRKCCLDWGYREVRTPTLEYLHLFTSTGTLTPGMLGKVYSFLDWNGWSGERIVLRPDGTIPVARLYIESMEQNQLARLFYVANVFIFEATGEDTRERWQCGVELIGAGSPLADVELVMLALEIVGKLKPGDVELRLSHAGLIRGLLTRLGLSAGEQARVFDQVLDGDQDALARLKTGKPELRKVLPPLLDTRGQSAGFLNNLKAVFTRDLANLAPPLDNFISIAELLETLGCRYQIDIASGRGFEYYTGLIFQLYKGERKIGGGGRYDALIPLMGGRSTPASGFALYLDSLMDLIRPQTPTGTGRQRVLVRAEPETAAEGFSLAQRLRQAGYVAELDPGGQEPANMSWALDIRSKAPRFILTNRTRNQRSEVQTIAEVLKLLSKEEQG